jgi:hypothetical protein
LLLAVLAAASIGTACGETAVSPDERSGGSQSGSHSSSAPKNDSKKAQHAALTDQKVSKKAQNASPSVPAVEEMSVFSRPRTEEDGLPSSLAYLLKGHQCDDWLRSQDRCPGEAKPEESRLLLTNLGARKRSLYAWPTTNGWVCVAPDDGGASCIRDFRPEGRGTRTAYMGMDPDTDGVGAPGTLLGVVPDDVSAVTVKVGGVAYPAMVKNNGVFYELADGSCSFWAFQSLTTTYRDGTSDTVPIDWRNGDRPMPETCEA